MAEGSHHQRRNAACSSSWNRLPPPSQKEALDFEAMFTNAEAEQIVLGLIPEQMEDKWFVYYEDGWLCFHRSWTGAFIYALRLQQSADGVRVVESWVNRNPEQYRATDTAHDRELVRFLIDAFLLKRRGIRFPRPAGVEAAPAGVVQHSYVGRAYPESGPSDES